MAVSHKLCAKSLFPDARDAFGEPRLELDVSAPPGLQPVHEDVASSWFIGQESSWLTSGQKQRKATHHHPAALEVDPPTEVSGPDAISPGSLSPFCSEQPVFPSWLLGTCVHPK